MVKKRISLLIAAIIISYSPLAYADAIHDAVNYQNIKYLKQLLSDKTTAATIVNTRRAGDGATPLILAIVNLNLEMVKMLIDAGAIVSIKDNDGYTAVDYIKKLIGWANTIFFWLRITGLEKYVMSEQDIKEKDKKFKILNKIKTTLESAAWYQSFWRRFGYYKET